MSSECLSDEVASILPWPGEVLKGILQLSKTDGNGNSDKDT